MVQLNINIIYCFGCHCRSCCLCRCMAFMIGTSWGFFLLMACAHDAHTRTQSWICGLNMNMFISSNQYYEKQEHMWRMAPFVSLSIHKHAHSAQVLGKTLSENTRTICHGFDIDVNNSTGWVSACLWILLVYVGVGVWLLPFSHIQIHFALAHGYTEIR